MGRGSADEAVVVVKVVADEGAVTYPRVNYHQAIPTNLGLEAKGGTCDRDLMCHYKLSS